MAVTTYEKHPLADLDYGYNLRRWLTPPEVVTTVEATKISGDVDLGPGVTDGQKMGVMISGGTDGTTSVINITGLTNSNPPRKFARTFHVYVTKKVGSV